MGYAMRVGCGDPAGAVQKTSMADDPKDTFKMPKRLELTDLEGRPSLPPLPTGPTSSVQLSSMELEDAPLDLEPQMPRPVEAMKRAAPPPRRMPWSWIVGVLVCCALALAGYHYLQSHQTDVEVELLDAPAGSKLVLDGAPIEGRVLRLTRSTETHRVTVFATGRPPRTVTFTANEDTRIELGP